MNSDQKRNSSAALSSRPASHLLHYCQFSHHRRMNLAIVEDGMIWIEVIGSRRYGPGEALSRLKELLGTTGIEDLTGSLGTSSILPLHRSNSMSNAALIHPCNHCANFHFYMDRIIARRSTRGPGRRLHNVDGNGLALRHINRSTKLPDVPKRLCSSILPR